MAFRIWQRRAGDVRSEHYGLGLPRVCATQHVLLANQPYRVDTALQVGDTSTKVEVVAEAAQLNVDNGVKQESIAPSVINELPLLVASGTPRNAVPVLIRPAERIHWFGQVGLAVVESGQPVEVDRLIWMALVQPGEFRTGALHIPKVTSAMARVKRS